MSAPVKKEKERKTKRTKRHEAYVCAGQKKRTKRREAYVCAGQEKKGQKGVRPMSVPVRKKKKKKGQKKRVACLRRSELTSLCVQPGCGGGVGLTVSVRVPVVGGHLELGSDQRWNAG